MTDYYFRKSGSHTLEAASTESYMYLKTCKVGDDILVTARKPRNFEFHKKIFALIKYAYLNIDLPENTHNGENVIMDMETFRSELIVIAGFYTAVVSLDGSITFKADSLEYKKCNAAKALKIYDAMLDVIPSRIFNGDYTAEELEKLSEQYLNFI